MILACLLPQIVRAEPAELDAAIDAIAPGVKKWATVCVITKSPDAAPAFAWHDYARSGDSTDFWPASAIKLYTAVAALEVLSDHGFPLDTTIIFEHREKNGTWVLDCARAMREALSEVFRRSSNEDYTLLLRMVGIDEINTHFLIPARGFPHSALMRGYVLGPPYGYTREDPQRITLRAADGRTETLSHTWSGRFYAEERGCTIFDARTGNVTSPRELGECMRRVMFHEHLAEQDRYKFSAEQLDFLRHGGGGLRGLETKAGESGTSSWDDGVRRVFPKARVFRKTGLISNYALEVTFVDDAAESGKQFILVPVIAAGSESKPVSGEKLVSQMAQAISAWVQRL